MIKRILSIILALLILSCLYGCNQDDRVEDKPTETTTDTDKTEPSLIEQTESDYIISTDWMTFYFSKGDFKESDVEDIAEEAVLVMTDVRNYLNVNCTLEEAKETVCYFDSTYRNKDGQKRSSCLWDEKKLYCISLDDFVHEYVHMISESNENLVYHPSKLFSEGLAQYVSLNFYDGIATKQYAFFKEESVSKNSNASEHQMICDLLSDNGLAYNAENYNKAFVAILDKNYDVTKIDVNSDFYKYIIGQIFVDYCINQLGGLEKFVSVYCDSVTVADVYGKSVDDLVIEACAYNTSTFYKD